MNKILSTQQNILRRPKKIISTNKNRGKSCKENHHNWRNEAIVESYKEIKEIIE